MNRFFQRSYWVTIFLFLFLLTPFFTPNNVKKSFEVGPIIWFYLVFSALAFCIGVSLILRKTGVSLIRVTIIDGLVLIPILIILVQSLVAEENLFLRDDILCYACLIGMYYIFRFRISKFNSLELNGFANTFLAAIIFTTLAGSAYGILQLFEFLPSNSKYFAVTGPYDNPARYANFLTCLMPFVIASYLFLRDSDVDRKYIAKIGGLVGAVCLLPLAASQTRAAWVGLFVGAFAMLLFKSRTTLRTIASRRLWLVGCLVTLLAVGAIIMYRMKPESALGRLTIWKVCSKLVADHPLAGSGYGNFKYVYNKYQSNYFAQNFNHETEIENADTVRYAYNIFIQLLAEQGVIGLVIFLFMLLCLAPKLSLMNPKQMSSKDLLLIAAWFSIITILTAGQFSYPLNILSVSIVFFFNISVISATTTNCSGAFKVQYEKVIKVRRVFSRSLGTILMLCGIVLIVHASNKYRAYKNWKSASSKDAHALSLICLELQGDVDFLDEYSNALLNDGKYSQVVTLLNHADNYLMYPSLYSNLAQAYAMSGNFSKAETLFKVAINMVPSRIYSRYLLAKFYCDTRQFEKSLAVAEDVLSMKIKVPSLDADEIVYKTKAIILKCEKRAK